MSDRGSTATEMSTAPSPPPSVPLRPGLGADLRRWWAQLTSMRTALILLFFLALAAVPGSLLPQRPLNPPKVTEFLSTHRAIGPWLDRLGLFDVFASPWFAAIYLLLFVSLVGCLVPRIRKHAAALFMPPPLVPRHLDRLPQSASFELSTMDGEALRMTLRRRRWRTVARQNAEGGLEISAEKGYLRETGNLLFHVSLVVMLVGVALGALWGWKANVLVTEGSAFCNTLQSYDTYTLGRDIGAGDLPPFCVRLDRFTASYLDSGEPKTYRADVRYGTGDPTRPTSIQVNEPLRLDGARVYLIDHGYAPILRYTDRFGQTFESPTPFLPTDPNLSSDGVAVFPDANQKPGATSRTPNVEVAFEGVFVPTLPTTGPKVISAHPAAKDPGVTLVAYRGDTGLGAGIPRSVYSLDRTQIDRGKLKKVGGKLLRLGQTWTLDDGSTVTFVGMKQWAGFRINHDPGQYVVLAAAIGMVLGLLCSLRVRRRRLWLRLRRSEGGRTVVEAGGLSRTDGDEFAAEFARLVDELSRKD